MTRTITCCLLCLAGLFIASCDSSPNCVDEVCEPWLVVSGKSESGDFPAGEIQVGFDADGESGGCTSSWPEAQGTAAFCSSAEIVYSRAEECTITETGIRCALTGAWTQLLVFREEPPTELRVENTFGDGTSSARTFSPEYLAPDPDRSDCSTCPATEEKWSLP